MCQTAYEKMGVCRCWTKKNCATDDIHKMDAEWIRIYLQLVVLLATNAPATGVVALHSCRSTAKQFQPHSQILKPCSVIYEMQAGFLWRNFSIHLSNQFQLTNA